MSLDHAILGFLDGEPMTGYDLKTRCFDRAASAFWTADQAQVYRTLERLEQAGYVASRLHPQPGRPDRKVFSITTPGRKALREWLETPHPLPPLRDPFLLQLFFSGVLSDQAVLALLGSARDGHQRRLEGLRSQAPRGGRGTAATRAEALRSMALRGAIAEVRAAIDWIDDCIERVSAGLPVNGDTRTAPTL
jgi:DNA-binding PadR family transcriptional regulator